MSGPHGDVMIVTGPRVAAARDVPDFRLWLLDQWKPDGLMYRVSETHRSMGDITWDHGSGLAAGWIDPFVSRVSVSSAALWWVSPEMTELVDHAARTLPPTTLTDDLLPDRDGLVVFATPLVGVEADTGEPINDVRALSWTIGRDRTPMLVIVSYRQVHGPLIGMGPVEGAERTVTVHGHQRGVHETRWVAEGMWVPAGTTGWLHGTDTEEVLFHHDDAAEVTDLGELGLSGRVYRNRWMVDWCRSSSPRDGSAGGRSPARPTIGGPRSSPRMASNRPGALWLLAAQPAPRARMCASGGARTSGARIWIEAHVRGPQGPAAQDPRDRQSPEGRSMRPDAGPPALELPGPGRRSNRNIHPSRGATSGLQPSGSPLARPDGC